MNKFAVRFLYILTDARAQVGHAKQMTHRINAAVKIIKLRGECFQFTVNPYKLIAHAISNSANITHIIFTISFSFPFVIPLYNKK